MTKDSDSDVTRTQYLDRPKLIVGDSDHQYLCQHGWGNLPKDHLWGITHGIANDRDGLIYIAHTVHPDSRCRDAIVVFKADGTFVRSLGNKYEGSAHGLEIVEEDETDFIYLTDLERGLFKLTLNGEVVWHFKKPSLYEKIFGLNWKPSNIALAPGTDLYLSDGYGTGFIIRIDRETGKELDYFGGPGKRDENLTHPHGLIVDTRQAKPLLLIADNLDNCFHYLTLDGEHVRFEHENDETLVAPRHFCIQNQLLLMPDLGGRLSLFDEANELITVLGDAKKPFEKLVPLHDLPTEKHTPGQFALPHDAIFDDDGNIYVVEWIATGRVSKLTPLKD